MAQSFMLIFFCLVILSNFRGNNPMQIAMPYRSGPRCADCPGHCDKGLCSKSSHSPLKKNTFYNIQAILIAEQKYKVYIDMKNWNFWKIQKYQTRAQFPYNISCVCFSLFYFSQPLQVSRPPWKLQESENVVWL